LFQPSPEPTVLPSTPHSDWTCIQRTHRLQRRRSIYAICSSHMDIIEEQSASSSRLPTCKTPSPPQTLAATSLNTHPLAGQPLSKKKSSSRLVLKRPSTAPVSSTTLPVLPFATNLEETYPTPFGPSQLSTGQFWPRTEEPVSDSLTPSSGANIEGLFFCHSALHKFVVANCGSVSRPVFTIWLLQISRIIRFRCD
jgi:hypothetical protein